MLWMRADRCAAALPVLHSAHCSDEARRPYQLLKRPVGRLPIPRHPAPPDQARRLLGVLFCGGATIWRPNSMTVRIRDI